jgi:hypothetical protein
MGQFSQEVYEYLEELDQMNWSARGNELNQYLRNTSIGTAVGGCLRKNSRSIRGSEIDFSHTLVF